jgi:hypothetical protein
MTLRFALRVLAWLVCLAFYGGIAGLVGVTFGAVPLVLGMLMLWPIWIDALLRAGGQRRRQGPLERPGAL